MKKIKGFFFSEKKLAKVIFSFLVIVAFMAISGPNLYAQFTRQTGDAGWGYGAGYGYGYGFGFDRGWTSGYRSAGGNYSQYIYGAGYGYLDDGVTFDASNGYNITPANVSDLVMSGIMDPDGNNAANTTFVTFREKVTMTVAAGTTVVIPSGTTFTAASASSFATLAGSATVSTTDLTSLTTLGSMSFGIPSLDLTVNPAITIAINVGTAYNGQTLKIYRKDAAGTWSYTGDGCVVASGICSFTTTHLSSFAVGTSTSGSTGGSGSSSGIISSTCTSVTYGDYAGACFNGYQYRNIVSRTPENCILTAAQQNATKKTCGTVDQPTIITTTDEVVSDNSGVFVALEKSLVKSINKALAKRLAGRILLQVENKGEAWYVSPVNGSKYFLGRPADAFAIMRKLALGVSNKTWATFKNGKAPAKLAGRILLKVEDNGMAYYVNPIDLKMHYLGRPADAFSVMRKLGLGVSNSNLRQIGVSEAK